jgi:hypothetical protein
MRAQLACHSTSPPEKDENQVKRVAKWLVLALGITLLCEGGARIWQLYSPNSYPPEIAGARKVLGEEEYQESMRQGILPTLTADSRRGPWGVPMEGRPAQSSGKIPRVMLIGSHSASVKLFESEARKLFLQQGIELWNATTFAPFLGDTREFFENNVFTVDHNLTILLLRVGDYRAPVIPHFEGGGLVSATESPVRANSNIRWWYQNSYLFQLIFSAGAQGQIYRGLILKDALSEVELLAQFLTNRNKRFAVFIVPPPVGYTFLTNKQIDELNLFEKQLKRLGIPVQNNFPAISAFNEGWVAINEANREEFFRRYRAILEKELLLFSQQLLSQNKSRLK